MIVVFSLSLVCKHANFCYILHQCHVQYKPKITRKSTAYYVNAVFKVPGKPKKKKRAPAKKAPAKEAPKKRKAKAVDEDAKPAAKKKKAKAVEEDAKPAAKKKKATKTAKKQSAK